MPWRRITRRPERHRSRAAEEAHLLLIERNSPTKAVLLKPDEVDSM
jgi:hypothetical protein